MDSCGTGIADTISQGIDWWRAKVAAFYFTKLNSAQQNYSVYKIKMLVGVKTMLQYWDILQGIKFTWYTDHKGLIYLLNQKNLSGRQAHWLEKLFEFDFEVVYVLGVKNNLLDSLSQLYSYDKPSTVHAWGKYTYHDVIDNNSLSDCLISMLVLIRMKRESISLLDTTPASRVDRLNDNHLETSKGNRQSAQTPTEAPKSNDASKNRTYQWRAIPLAETDQAKMSREFAARMTKDLVLKGPQQWKKGENETHKKLTIWILVKKRNLKHEHEWEFANRSQQLQQTIDVINPVTLIELMAGGQEPIDFLENISEKYNKDTTLSIVVEKSWEHKNFEYTKDKLLYLSSNRKRVVYTWH